ncbi:MAG: hypothetical protein KGZ65_00910 [Sphingomonadales bacterium]|nr:hypothetical protein [Sphingomonadaceae bacterium]MBS3929765.1 hypothetical protein [Sphingomonadales bacterium]
MAFNHRIAVLAGVGAVALSVWPVLAQRAPTSGPVARYDMRAGTVSGMMAMGGGMGGAMGVAFGGGGDKVQKELYLRLGSSQAPAKGAAKADHFMPPVAKLGKSVALATPKEEKAGTDELPQKPKGRILIFWGCGERAPKGQPVVIDLAKIAAGQAPPGLWTAAVLRDWGPTLQNSKTFGRWPAEDRKFVKTDSSLIGAHRVAGNYSPEIAFNLTQDFMAALRATNTANASGSALLSWNAVPGATGYLAWMFGGKMGPDGEMGDMVMWTSSASRQFGGGLTDWLSPGQVAGLVRDRTVMAPATTSCIIPQEVRKAGPDFRMGMLTAYGPEENFAYPPRPADPKAAWNLVWTARVRHRSMTSWMDMPGMAGMPGQTGEPPQEKKCKPKGIGGILGGVIKGGC